MRKKLTSLTQKNWVPRLRILLAVTCGVLATLSPAADPRPALAIIVSGVSLPIHGALLTNTSKDARQAESELADCIGQAVSARHLDLALMKPEDFYHLAFPALTSEEAPRSLDSLKILLGDAAFRKRLEVAGVAYLVVAGGTTERQYHSHVDKIHLVPPYFTPVIWGEASTWDNEARFAAYIIDLKREIAASEVTAAANDESGFGAYIFVPTGTFSRAQGEACTKIGTSVADALTKVVSQSEHR